MNKTNNLGMILDVVQEVGINFQSLGDDIGVARSTVCGWRDGIRYPKNPEKVISAIKKRIFFLKNISIKNVEDLTSLRDDTGIRESKLAKFLGFSRQYLNREKMDGTLSDEKLKEIEGILRGIGNHLDDIIHKYPIKRC